MSLHQIPSYRVLFSSAIIESDSLIDMVLPTGAMGNLTGAYMAKQMGIPIGRLYCGVNINGEKGQTKSRTVLVAGSLLVYSYFVSFTIFRF